VGGKNKASRVKQAESRLEAESQKASRWKWKIAAALAEWIEWKSNRLIDAKGGDRPAVVVAALLREKSQTAPGIDNAPSHSIVIQTRFDAILCYFAGSEPRRPRRRRRRCRSFSAAPADPLPPPPNRSARAASSATINPPPHRAILHCWHTSAQDAQLNVQQ
jgi:hypothetical protein